MESASKRKAAAALGDGDGRPAKRQKAPVRTALGYMGKCRRWRLGETRVMVVAMREDSWTGARHDWVDQQLLSSPPAPPNRRNNTTAASTGDTYTCLRAGSYGPIRERPADNDAGRFERECRDNSDDHSSRLEVPRQLESSKGQNVRALPLPIASLEAIRSFLIPFSIHCY